MFQSFSLASEVLYRILPPPAQNGPETEPKLKKSNAVAFGDFASRAKLGFAQPL